MAGPRSPDITIKAGNWFGYSGLIGLLQKDRSGRLILAGRSATR